MMTLSTYYHFRVLVCKAQLFSVMFCVSSVVLSTVMGKRLRPSHVYCCLSQPVFIRRSTFGGFVPYIQPCRKLNKLGLLFGK